LKDERENVEILIIDKSSHFEFICTNYKSLCDDDSFEYLTVNNENAMDSLNRDLRANQTEEQEEHKPVKFYQGLLTSIIPHQNVIIVDKIEGAHQIPEKVEIVYDSLVICTGASYPSPWRDGPQDY
jgi:NADH dehydrogenase FAD-containing subunit